MPVPGVPNNPSGVNGFDDFATEPAYGEVKKQKALLGSAPMAGGKIAAGAVNAPDTSQRKATSSSMPAPGPAPVPPGDPMVAPMSTAEWFTALAAEPGAERYPILAWLRDTARG